MLQHLGHAVLAAVQRDGGVAAPDDLLDGGRQQHRGGHADHQGHPGRPGGERAYQRLWRRHGQQPVAGAHREGQVAHPTSQRKILGGGHDHLRRDRSGGVVQDHAQFVERRRARLSGRLHRTERALAVEDRTGRHRRPSQRKTDYPVRPRAEHRCCHQIPAPLGGGQYGRHRPGRPVTGPQPMTGADDHDVGTVFPAQQGKGQRPRAGGDVSGRFPDEQGRTAVGRHMAEARHGRLQRANGGLQDQSDLVRPLDEQAVALVAFDGARHQRHAHTEQKEGHQDPGREGVQCGGPARFAPGRPGRPARLARGRGPFIPAPSLCPFTPAPSLSPFTGAVALPALPAPWGRGFRAWPPCRRRRRCQPRLSALVAPP